MLKLSNFVTDSIVDGPGIRATVFCQGCPHHCEGCHNPQTWPFEGGTEMPVEEIFAQIQKNPLCRGVTFSGGEPFAQAEGYAKLGRLLKAAGYEVAAYTGYAFEQLQKGTTAQRELLETVDILIDGPFVLSERSLELSFRGSRNQRILDVPQSLLEGRAVETRQLRWSGEYEV